MKSLAPACAAALTAAGLALTPLPATSMTVAIEGTLDLILEDDGSGLFGNTPLGTTFSGFIDDVTYNGLLGNGTSTVPFGCCIAAGGLEVFNDQVLDVGTAFVLNRLIGTPVYAAGDLIDSLNLEGDAATASGGRIEIGVSYIFAPDTFADDSPANYPFDPADVQLSLFFVLEQNAAGDDIYDVLGVMPMAPIPEPGTLALWLAGLAASGAAWRRKGRR